MAKALLHRDKNVGIASCLNVDHAVGMQSGQMQSWRKEVMPAQAPENRAFRPGQNPSQKNGRGGIVT